MKCEGGRFSGVFVAFAGGWLDCVGWGVPGVVEVRRVWGWDDRRGEGRKLAVWSRLAKDRLRVTCRCEGVTELYSN
jgi:hypothetical protein